MPDCVADADVPESIRRASQTAREEDNVMFPDPLHPALVHFPIVFAVLMPVVAIAVLWAIRRGIIQERAWRFVIALAAGLVLASWIAVQTGEQQEERVEEVVAESALASHEEAAELFLLLTWATLAAAAVGVATGVIGSSARIVSVVLALVVLVAGWRVGNSGGELVYRHDAAQAYAPDGSSRGAPAHDSSLMGSTVDDDDEHD
jgi:uncharacterized membrane protein